ncbi:alpha/beta hydrolase family protein [Rhodococcus sp. ARC_M12]|uniref:alpha/beta hydrolase n=1 Tax=Rhodococcus sp. ARC_M12 TaxID=2928854 RepID=UPI001FB20AE8|nr:alpha/beta hydrolase [Rhodococcus sp. ARC_M12]MCJ0978979.1 alpha/beta hydrolase family protein [Rhodococcus sp. ARC_M12]
MVTLDQFRSWDSRVLATVSEHLMRRWRDMTGLHDSATDEMMFDGWRGPAADAAREALGRIRLELSDATDELLRIATCTADAAIDMASVVAALRAVEQAATDERFTVGSDGTVTDTASYSVASADLWSTRRERRRRCEELTDRISQLVRSATDFDDALARRLAGRASADAIATVVAASVPHDATPAANAAFWSALSPAARTRLLVEQPALIGNLDGLPGRVRDSANRRVLVAERIRLRATESKLRKELEGNTFGGLFTDADAGLEQTRARLASLDAIEAALERGGRQLLVLDNSSYEETMAAVAVGDVDTATHVAVFVPGLDSTVHGNGLRYDGDMENLKQAVQQLLPGDTSQTAAAVTWLDYQAPQLGWSMLDPDRTVVSGAAARAGADRLAPFLDGLDAARASDPHLSVLAHSYGSLTAAAAFRNDTGVDDFVALGSPGLGTHSVEDLRLPTGHVFAAEAGADVVADLGAFGRDPGVLDGITLLATDGSDGLIGSRGHSDYLTDGTTSAHNAALVVADRSEEAVIRTRPGLFDLVQRILYL